MKKILIVSLLIFTLVGCGFKKTPSDKVEKYLDNYVSLSEDVNMDLDTTIKGENLSETNASIYKEVLQKQYKNLKYEIKDEMVDGKDATVIVKITVYDLYKSGKESDEYMNDHTNEFNDENNMFDLDKFNKYKLENMLKMNDTIDYEITFKLTKSSGEWVIEEPNREVLSKIHGLYDYEND